MVCNETNYNKGPTMLENAKAFAVVFAVFAAIYAVNYAIVVGFWTIVAKILTKFLLK